VPSPSASRGSTSHAANNVQQREKLLAREEPVGTMPMKNGEIMAAIAMAPYALPICVSVK